MSIQDDCIHMGGNHRDEDGDADSCALSQAFMMMTTMMMMMAMAISQPAYAHRATRRQCDWWTKRESS